MGIDNKTLLQKADTALSDLTSGGGILLPAQADKFIRLLIKGSTLMQLATVTPMKAPKQDFPNIKFGSRVLRAGTEGQAVAQGDRAAPDLDYVELDAKLFKAEVRLTDEVLEDSIERGNFKETVIELLAEAISRDMEEVIISGDTTSGDAFLAKLDGVLKLATANVYDCGVNGGPMNADLFFNMIKLLPSEYLRDKSQLRFFVSTDGELTYRNKLIQRATVGGDKYLETDAPVLYSGVPVIPVPMFPETLGGTLDRTVALLTNPKNIYVGIWRNIRIEQWRDPSEGVLKIAASLRFDTKYADKNAVVKATNVKVSLADPLPVFQGMTGPTGPTGPTGAAG